MCAHDFQADLDTKPDLWGPNSLILPTQHPWVVIKSQNDKVYSIPAHLGLNVTRLLPPPQSSPWEPLPQHSCTEQFSLRAPLAPHSTVNSYSHLFFSQTASQTRFCECKPDYTTLLMETLQAHPASTVQASSHLPWPTAAVTLPRVPSLTAKLGFSLTVTRFLHRCYSQVTNPTFSPPPPSFTTRSLRPLFAFSLWMRSMRAVPGIHWKLKKTWNSLGTWCAPVVPPAWEAYAGGLLDPSNSRTAWATQQNCL